MTDCSMIEPNRVHAAAASTMFAIVKLCVCKQLSLVMPQQLLHFPLRKSREGGSAAAVAVPPVKAVCPYTSKRLRGWWCSVDRLLGASQVQILLPHSLTNEICIITTRDDTTKMTGHFEGYVEVPSKDEVAVMEALYKHGPLAVGVDASFDEFLFYRCVCVCAVGWRVLWREVGGTCGSCQRQP